MCANVSYIFHRNTTHCANKLLCFTRTSPLIEQFPNEYFGPSSKVSLGTWMEHYVCHDLKYIAILKISSAHTQTYIEYNLIRFMQSNSKLLLVIVRIPEVTKRMVNHLRIMIEEAENAKTNNKKLVVLLLHFPSTSFFDPCYPSLYLKGWDHYYLDSIGHGTMNSQGQVTELLAVKQWFTTCCFHTSASDITKEQMCHTLEGVICEAMSIVSPKILIPTVGNGKFNKPMSPTERIESISIILNDLQFGTQLAEVFCSYWTPQVMKNLILRLTHFTHSNKSTLNLTDSIQSTFRSLFFDFLIYMLNQFNDDYSFDVLFECMETDKPTKVMTNLCRSLIAVLPKPDLSQLPILCKRYSQPHHPVTRIPNFPLFGLICSRMDDAISTCKKMDGGSDLEVTKDGCFDISRLCNSVLNLIKVSC